MGGIQIITHSSYSASSSDMMLTFGFHLKGKNIQVMLLQMGNVVEYFRNCSAVRDLSTLNIAIFYWIKCLIFFKKNNTLGFFSFKSIPKQSKNKSQASISGSSSPIQAILLRAHPNSGWNPFSFYGVNCRQGQQANKERL